MKAAIKEASALRCEIHSLWNFPERKWQKLHRNDIEHSFGDWNLNSDDVPRLKALGARQAVPHRECENKQQVSVVLRCNGTGVFL